jgi:8-oxo-dGTP pyrophosphatase MutT (NUDIX family)
MNHTNSDTETNPWITHTTEQVYESAWIQVTKSDVTNPAGKPAIYSVVHFKNLAIGVLPLDKDYNTWLVGQFRYPTNEYGWEIPEGGGKKDTDPVDSASRELKEETGIIAKNYDELMRLHLSNSATDELAIVYLATNLSFEEAEPEESEQLQVKKLHLNEAFDMVMQGKITDAITMAAILKAKWMLDNDKLFV